MATRKRTSEPPPPATEGAAAKREPAGKRVPTSKRPRAVASDGFVGFSPALLEFFAELAANNDRAWFEANRGRYEEHVREPALAFIRAMRPRLAKLSKHLSAEDKKVGGALMRVHRDTRFAADKTPYKTNLGVQFRHVTGKDVHAPGLYFHVDGDEVFLGAGSYRPEAAALAAIRARIVEQPGAWAQAVSAPAFTAHWRLWGESLSRPPRGFAKDHPQIEDLKRKDHIAATNLGHRELFSPDLVEIVTERFAATKPYMKFLCAALDIPF